MPVEVLLGANPLLVQGRETNLVREHDVLVGNDLQLTGDERREPACGTFAEGGQVLLGFLAHSVDHEFDQSLGSAHLACLGPNTRYAHDRVH